MTDDLELKRLFIEECESSIVLKSIQLHNCDLGFEQCVIDVETSTVEIEEGEDCLDK